MAVLKYRNTETGEWEAIPPIIQGGSSESVSYSQSQNLTDEQKEIARNNINAVDASLVVSSISDDSQIPNGAGIRDAIEEFTLHECVRYDVKQPIIDEYKRIARENMGAISQTELNEAIGDINSILATVVNGGVS